MNPPESAPRKGLPMLPNIETRVSPAFETVYPRKLQRPTFGRGVFGKTWFFNFSRNMPIPFLVEGRYDTLRKVGIGCKG